MLVLNDDTRLAAAPGHANTRIVFYYATIFTDEPTQVQGATLLHVIKSGERPELDLSTEGWEMFRTGLPMKFKQIIVVAAYEEGKQALLNHLAHQAALAEEFKSRHRTELIVSDSIVGTLQLLESRGCERPLLPPCLGGGFEYSQFAEWMRMRISVEDILSAPPVSNNRSAPQQAQGGGGGPKEDEPNSLSLEPTPPKRKPSEKLDEDSIRKRNALYSRRMYHKRKLELLSLQEQCKVLQTRNDSLKQEAARLEGLLESARAIIIASGNPAMLWR